MSACYTRDQLKISVVKILQILGWNSITSTPLEILTDILSKYLAQIAMTSNSYANEFGCTQPNLDHLGLCFRDMNVSVAELEEYVRYVNFGPGPKPVPKYPILKEDHLNFLKPGSKEVVTRPVHIHEHLPPMNPLFENAINDNEAVTCKTEEPIENSNDNSQVFKKPSDIPAEFKKPSFRREEEGSRPTREISSVMMTTSGFLSPAREGKLPEARTPITQVEQMNPVISNVENVDTNKKMPKVLKKLDKRKERVVKTPFKLMPDEKVKKLHPMKAKNKLNNNNNFVQNDIKINSINTNIKMNQNNKVSKALAAARLKTEKLNTTITPITIKPINNILDNVDKLFTEPDKKKVNIFKKISNVKNEKIDIKSGNKKDEFRSESRGSSPDLIIDEPDDIVAKLPHLPNDVTIEPINNVKSPEKIEHPYFDDSPPGTPSTPKTPEMISHSPPLVKEKRKRKDGRRIKRIQKHVSPHRLDADAMDIDMERPKTPEAHLLTKPDVLQPPMGANFPPAPLTFPFLNNFGGPGLIPPPLAIAFSSLNMHNFGQKAYPSPIPAGLPIRGATPPPNIPLHPQKFEDPNIISPIIEKLSPNVLDLATPISPKQEKKSKEHKKEKKDKIKKRNKKDKIKNKAEKKKLKEEKKEKVKKEKKEKRKEKEYKDGDSPAVKITLKIKSPSPRPETPETRKLNIKPILKKDESSTAAIVEERKRETSPGLAKISALVTGPPKQKTVNAQVTTQPAEEAIHQETPVTPLPRTGPGPGRPRIHPLKPKTPPKPKKRRSPVKKDAEGNEVWICPACGRQDDGSPMIGCDGCDAWYHWVCVGIQVPPDDSEDWYCRHCLLKKNEDLQNDKQKKKRKKREKKEH